MDASWAPLSISEAARRFADHDVDWWVAGGMAIDHFLGWESRPHDDLDLEMYRSDRDVLFDVFEGWDLHRMSEGELAPWRRGDPLPDTAFAIWVRPSPSDAWSVELMLADGDEDTWRYRRNPSITLPRSQLTATSRDGVAYCVPEVQLLYKAKQARPKDDVDLARCLPLMSTTQKEWLRAAIATMHPDHPWIAVLDMSTWVSTEER